MAKSVAILRGMFNPPTTGHLSIIRKLSSFDEIVLVPSLMTSKGEAKLDYVLRCKLLEAFLYDINIPNVKMLAVESEITSAICHVSTRKLMKYLMPRYEGYEITLALGPDQMKTFLAKSDNEKLLGKIDILVCSETSQVRSEYVREKVFRNVDISDDTTKSVISIINEKNLYDELVDCWTVG